MLLSFFILKRKSISDYLQNFAHDQDGKRFLYRLKVQQGVYSLGLGGVVLLIHVSPVLGSPLGDDDGESWKTSIINPNICKEVFRRLKLQVMIQRGRKTG